MFSFKPNGQLLYDVALDNPGSPQPSTTLLGLVFQKSSQTLLIFNLADGIVYALTFDNAGNVYVSDSFLRVIWNTGPNGGTPTMFVDSQTLSPEATPGVILVLRSGRRRRQITAAGFD